MARDDPTTLTRYFSQTPPEPRLAPLYAIFVGAFEKVLDGTTQHFPGTRVNVALRAEVRRLGCVDQGQLDQAVAYVSHAGYAFDFTGLTEAGNWLLSARGAAERAVML